ncbi:MAG: hypothetical protein QNJ48_13200 [Desulfobacterales bacterium]|nr:hypothetical protein [Desulfobacterales bacterium]MDJ0885117.1 hypothetical protein [Desulfobacterales bacterium]
MTQKLNWKVSERFTALCMQILNAYPEAIGVAYKVLDCGCALLCGVSASSQPLGPLRHLSGQPRPSDRRAPICLKCKRDDGLRNRVVREGIFWPGTISERPELELRNLIGRSVFGAHYNEES